MHAHAHAHAHAQARTHTHAHVPLGSQCCDCLKPHAVATPDTCNIWKKVRVYLRAPASSSLWANAETSLAHTHTNKHKTHTNTHTHTHTVQTYDDTFASTRFTWTSKPQHHALIVIDLGLCLHQGLMAMTHITRQRFEHTKPLCGDDVHPTHGMGRRHCSLYR
eukprot:6467275-Amphidinium_carterae.1